ncbi:MAG: BON domain-containing protein [Gammaproteobacteria bacterium]|nr:BON domain-containing protein [Gammaproteobacteria bacterium]MBV8405413.1 BON domain-containing protein [Gammaproteobacteria bacterium]
MAITLLAATLLGGSELCLAQAAAKKTSAPLEEIIVQGTRSADEQITERVQSALANDRWIYAEHVIVTTEKGVVRVEGLTSDSWEMHRILREARKTPGVKRVLNQLEMLHLDPEGG